MENDAAAAATTAHHGGGVTSAKYPIDLPPRHCRMGISPNHGDGSFSSNNNSSHFGSSSPVKHFSQRRRFFASDVGSNSSVSSSANVIPLVEQVVIVDRSPTKPERTYSVSVSLSGSRGGGGGLAKIPVTRRATSSKEEEKARQFLKEVEDRKALKALKEQTLGLADLPAATRMHNGASLPPPPPPPLDERGALSSPRTDRRRAEVPSSIQVPPTGATSAEDAATIYSDLSFNDTPPRSAASRAVAAPPQIAARMAVVAPPLSPPEAATSAGARMRECPTSIQQLMVLPAARYSTRPLPAQDEAYMSPTAEVDRQRNPCPMPRRHHSIRGPGSHPQHLPQPQSPPSAPANHHHCHRSSCRDHRANEATPSPSPTPSPRSPHRPAMLIQVAPGMQASLRSSDETWEAIKNDFYMPGLCWGCEATLFVIQDAAYVLCPDCHTVSPMDGTYVDKVNAGVGLGFKYDDLVRWQAEILEEQKIRHR